MISLTAIFWAAFAVFLVGRFGLGIFGGRKEKKRKLTRFYRHNPAAVFTIGALLFFAGFVTLSVGTAGTRYV